jgi:TolA-binding protein
MAEFSGVSIISALAIKSEDLGSSIRKNLTDLYDKIRVFENEIKKLNEEQEKIKNEKIILMKELEENNNLTKLEKMKKQMDLFIIEAQKTEEINSNDENINIILEQIKELEITIFVSCRFNTTWYPSSDIIENYNFDSMKNYEESYNSKKLKVQVGEKGVLEELKPIYEYYKNAKDILKDNEEKLSMLEELIDGMATEVIKEDMKKNNVVLPEFVRGMKYFKHEDEE